MKLELNHIGSFGGNPAEIIELKAVVGGTISIENLTVSDNMVSYDLIENLREIANELEDHNQKVSRQEKHNLPMHDETMNALDGLVIRPEIPDNIMDRVYNIESKDRSELRKHHAKKTISKWNTMLYDWVLDARSRARNQD